MYCYCLFCLTAKQNELERLIAALYPCRVMNTRIVQKHWKAGQAAYVKRLLLPGYLFLYAEDKLAVNAIARLPGVIRMLKNEDQSCELHNENEAFALWILESGGEIAVSKAIREGDHIRVIKGPMADFNGRLITVNKQRQRAEVEFTFDGLPRRVWMSFDWIDQELEQGLAGIRRDKAGID